MKPLKYRAYDLDKKEMFDVYQIQFQDNGITVRKRGSLNKSENAPKNVVLMQFTGLHDRHGKEIWEGDILGYYSGMVPKGTDPYVKQTVKWNVYRWDGIDNWKISEVIGTIYEGGE